MLNLQPVLDARLWTAIETNYQSGNFTGVIVDSIHFLGELIRDRSGLETDGVALVGAAFGGANPKLKVSSLQTESDKNFQSGTEQLLRGIYQGIRNPRSHEKHSDSSDDAEAIVLFINYLVRIIDRSKSPFEMDSYLEQVFDPAFAENSRYADLIVAQIPERKRWDTLLTVYRLKESRGRHWKKLEYFFQALLKMLTPEEISAFCEVVSEELKTTHSDATIIRIFQILPAELWPKYGEVARIRTEAKMIASIRDGRFNRVTSTCSAGVLGTWAADRGKYFVLKNQLVLALLSRLRSSDEEEQDYAFQFGVTSFPEFLPIPNAGVKAVLEKGLAAGDIRYHRALWFLNDDYANLPPPQEWREALGRQYDEFVEKTKVEAALAALKESIGADDVPF